MSESKRYLIITFLILFGMPLAANPALIPGALCGFAICAAISLPEDKV